MLLDGFLWFLILPETAKDESESDKAKVILGPNNSSVVTWLGWLSDRFKG